MTTVFQRVRVGPYEIVHEIGRGGMAVVFFATDSRDDRRVALKLVPIGTDRDTQESVNSMAGRTTSENREDSVMAVGCGLRCNANRSP